MLGAGTSGHRHGAAPAQAVLRSPEFVLAAMDVTDQLIDEYGELAPGQVVAVVSRVKRGLDHRLTGGEVPDPKAYAVQLRDAARRRLG